MTSSSDSQLLQILEACYAAEAEGREPDLTALCAAAPELRPRIERMLQRERDAVARATGVAAEREPLPRPARIGDFTVLELIGVGGMSHVYRARQEALGREVALKVLRAELVASDTGRLRFAREASITSALEHPHIVPVYAAGQADGHVYLAMKLLRGPSLDRMGAPCTPQEVARIGLAVASALQAAHEIGVVHRDLKPANVVVEHGHAFVVDFGVAAFAHQAGVLTRPDSTPGTLVYLAPELARRSSFGLDPRVDVYGLGVTLYELLAGRPPFAADNPVRALHQILHVDPPALGLRGKDRDLETIVLRAMEKQPARRFQTAGQMAEDLAAWLDGRAIRSRPVGWLERGLRFVRRHRLVCGLSAVATVAVAALGVSSWQAQSARTRRIDAAEQQVRQALATGDVKEGLRALGTLGAEGAVELVPPLAAELGCERQLQQLLAMVLSPLFGGDVGGITSLADALAASPAALAKSPRADALLALAALAAGTPERHPIGATTRLALPRTTAVLLAAADDRSTTPPRDLGAVSGGPVDHLLAAAAMRLVGEPEAMVERELRGVAADASLHFALATTCEGQMRLREALDLHGQLTEHAVFGTLSLAACARLAALLIRDGGGGDSRNAFDYLRRATEAASREPWLVRPVVLSELQVLDSLGDPQCEQRWQQLQAQLQQVPEYWRLGGYSRVDALDLTVARERFAAGLAVARGPGMRGLLETALLQVAWKEANVDTLDPLPDSDARRRASLAKLLQQAEAFAIANERRRITRSSVGDALLVAAQVRRALGDVAGSWQRLEQVCREHDSAEAHATYAYHAAYRAATVLLGGSDPDAGSAAPLPIAAARGLEYARRVLARVELGAPLDEQYRSCARKSAFVCALLLGDASVALPFALEYRGKLAELDRFVQPTIEWGGVWLEKLDVEGAQCANLLRTGLHAVERAWSTGRIDAATARSVLERWRGHDAVEDAAADQSPCWTELRADLAALAARLK